MRRDRSRIATRVSSIQDSDILTLTRPDRNVDVSITWRDAVSQIIGSVDQARQAIVDYYDTLIMMLTVSIDYIQQKLDAKAERDHHHVMADVDGLAAALSAKATSDQITAAVNAEAAIRSYADTQEGQARVAGDNALDARVSALEGNRAKKFAADFGNGVLTSFTFNHGLGTADVIVQVFAKSNGLLLAPSTVSRTATQVTVTFVLAVGLNANRVVIIG